MGLVFGVVTVLVQLPVGRLVGIYRGPPQFRILVEQGDANAQFNLGSMYDFGEGVPSARESNRDTGRALLTQDLTQVLKDPNNLQI